MIFIQHSQTLSSIKKAAISSIIITLSSLATASPTLAIAKEVNSDSNHLVAKRERAKPKGGLKIKYALPKFQYNAELVSGGTRPVVVEAKAPSEKDLVKKLRQGGNLEKLAEIFNDRIGHRLSGEIPVYVIDCKGVNEGYIGGNPINARYSSSAKDIVLCSEFIEDVLKTFQTPLPNRTEEQNKLITSNAENNAYNTLLGILLHESGHMLIDQLKIPTLGAVPVLGKEEDAVDSFAAYFLLTFVQEPIGSQLVASQALYWDKSFRLRDPKISVSESLDEHSYNPQRAAGFNCALASLPKYKDFYYGSYAEVLAISEKVDKKIITDTFDRCTFSLYEKQAASWRSILFSVPSTTGPGGQLG